MNLRGINTMNILSILGSPRKKGNTATALDYLEEQLRQRGNTVQHIFIADYKIHGCIECNGCKQEGVLLCKQNDDAIAILQDVLKADTIIFSAPTFCWGFPAQLKALLDRMYCFIKEEKDTYKTLIEGKITALLVTAGGEVKNNAELLGKAYENMVEFMRLRSAGIVYIAPCSGPESINDSIKHQLTQLAENISTLMHS